MKFLDLIHELWVIFLRKEEVQCLSVANSILWHDGTVLFMLQQYKVFPLFYFVSSIINLNHVYLKQ